MDGLFKDKNIIVTGGAGSIGSELVRTLLSFDPKVIRVFDNNENGLAGLELELQSEKIRLFVGDIQDIKRVKRAFENVDMVFHAAALKHVPLGEYNPFEVVKTNVMGTQNVIEAALDNDVNKVIIISTDKAVNPRSVLGATKFLAERLAISANYYKGKRKSIFACVRFGNVLGSSGSVVPIFEKQIKRGGPVTITNLEMTRFVMSTRKAVELILKAAQIAKGGEIFVLSVPAIRMGDLAEAMIEDLAPKYGYKPEEIKIKNIGKRPGEKMHEELITEDEAAHATDVDGLLILNSMYAETNGIDRSMLYASDTVKKLSKNQIKKMLEDLH